MEASKEKKKILNDIIFAKESMEKKKSISSEKS